MKLQKEKHNNKQRKHILLRLLQWIQQVNIYWLAVFPLVLSLLLLSGLLFVGNKVYDREFSEVFYSVSGAICLIIASLSGVAQVIRREGPGLFGQPVYGIWPIISGSILIIACWGIAFYLLAYAFYFKR